MGKEKQEYYSFVDFMIFEKDYKGEVKYQKIREKWSKYKHEYIKYCKKHNYMMDNFY